MGKPNTMQQLTSIVSLSAKLKPFEEMNLLPKNIKNDSKILNKEIEELKKELDLYKVNF